MLLPGQHQDHRVIGVQTGSPYLFCRSGRLGIECQRDLVSNQVRTAGCGLLMRREELMRKKAINNLQL